MARANYAISKMESNEFEIALGAIEPISGKSMAPKEMGVGFVWAASNAPNYVHHSTGNDLRNVFYGGNTFHGFLFAKEKAGADLYKDTIELVLAKRAKMGIPGASEIQTKYKNIIKGRDSNPYKHDKNLIKNLWTFWQDHYDILHPILQGTSPLLAMIAEDENEDPGTRQRSSEYIDMLASNMQALEHNIKSKEFQENFKSMNATYTFDNSYLYFQHSKKPYRSFKTLLDNMSWDSVTKEINGFDRGAIFEGTIVPYLRYLRDDELFNSNEKFQKEQFHIFYHEIMDKFSKKTNGISEKNYKA